MLSALGRRTGVEQGRGHEYLRESLHFGCRRGERLMMLVMAGEVVVAYVDDGFGFL